MYPIFRKSCFEQYSTEKKSNSIRYAHFFKRIDEQNPVDWGKGINWEYLCFPSRVGAVEYTYWTSAEG